MHPAISYELATARIADLRRQAIAGVPMTRHQPASGYRPGQQWPWIGAEEPR